MTDFESNDIIKNSEDFPEDTDTVSAPIKKEKEKRITKYGKLELQELGENELLVTGYINIKYRRTLKEKGGELDRELKGWKFGTSKYDELKKFVDDVNDGKIKFDEFNKKKKNSNSNSDYIGMPSIYRPAYANPRMQRLVYNVFKPSVGMTASVKVGPKIMTYEVTNVNNKKGKVDEALVTWPDGETVSSLSVCGGRWQVVGMVRRHSVMFK